MNDANASLTEPFMTVREAAEYTGYAVGTIYNYVSQGRIPFHRRSKGAPRFKATELDAWVRGDWTPAGEAA